MPRTITITIPDGYTLTRLTEMSSWWHRRGEGWGVALQREFTFGTLTTTVGAQGFGPTVEAALEICLAKIEAEAAAEPERLRQRAAFMEKYKAAKPAKPEVPELPADFLDALDFGDL